MLVETMVDIKVASTGFLMADVMAEQWVLTLAENLAVVMVDNSVY